MSDPGRGLAPASTGEGGVRHGKLARRALLAGGAALGAAAFTVTRGTSAEALSDADARALNLLLLVEYTEAAFYDDAIRRGRLTGEIGAYAKAVAGHERAHLEFVKKALGKQARRKPDFDFGDSTSDNSSFAAAAARLEDLAVAAYNGQATNVTPGTLTAAAGIVSVEARHAAWIRSIVHVPPASDATDPSRSAGQVLDGLSGLGMRR
jgi:Ferritin-like domain